MRCSFHLMLDASIWNQISAAASAASATTATVATATTVAAGLDFKWTQENVQHDDHRFGLDDVGYRFRFRTRVDVFSADCDTVFTLIDGGFPEKTQTLRMAG